MTLKEFREQSPAFTNKFDSALLNAVRKVVTKDSLLQYFKDNNLKINYENVNNINLVEVYDYFAYDIGDILATEIDIPQDIFLSSNFIDNLIDLMDYDPVDKYFYRIWNQVLLPLTELKVKDLVTIKDTIGDKHKIDIDNFDLHNREKPFLIIDRDIYIGDKYYEHYDISKELTERGINDKDVAVLYGHIVNNIAFIDLSRTINPSKIDMATIKTIIDNEPSLIKAYTTPEDRSISRSAKKLK